jgi:DNA-directed RNA polymerase subunit RPC12/RpoP
MTLRGGRMLRARGPDCHKCGAPMDLLDAGNSGARPWALFDCGFCGEQMSIGARPQLDAKSNGRIKYQTVRCRCPHCNHPNPTVVSTVGSVRFHKCQKCRRNFSSDEA